MSLLKDRKAGYLRPSFQKYSCAILLAHQVEIIYALPDLFT